MKYGPGVDKTMYSGFSEKESWPLQQPVSTLNYVPLFTAYRNTRLDAARLTWGVAEGAGKYAVLIVLPVGSVTLANGVIVSSRILLSQAAGAVYDFTTVNATVNAANVPELEPGETLVLAFDTNSTGVYAATTPSAIRNLLIETWMRDKIN